VDDPVHQLQLFHGRGCENEGVRILVPDASVQAVQRERERQPVFEDRSTTQ